MRPGFSLSASIYLNKNFLVFIHERKNLPFEKQAQIPSASVISALENGAPEIRCPRKSSLKIITGPERVQETK